MSGEVESKPADKLPALPPVEAPTGTFILQLFLIPLVIVSIVVLLWLMFSWMAHMGRDNPATIVRQLKKLDDNSWQRAYELADLLRSPDPKYDELRRDSALCQELCSLLEADLATPARGKEDKSRVQRRMFLCRAIGSFHVMDGLPILVRCAGEERSLVEAEVRLSALEAISTLARNVGPEKIQAEEKVMEVVLAASKQTDDEEPPPIANGNDAPFVYRPHSEVRAVAAYTLGIVGGEEASERLAMMLHDLYPNARYNAATGLARQGDARCIPILREMLQPDNKFAAQDERGEKDKDNKRSTVIRNGIQATVLLAQKNPQADVAPLKAALETLVKSDLANIKVDRSKLQIAAKEGLHLLEAAHQPAKKN